MVGKLRELRADESLHAFYGSELRRWRDTTGVSLTDLAKRLNYSKTQVSRIEAAERAPSRQLSARLDELLGTGGYFERLWTHVDREVFPNRARRYIELEQRATRIRAFHANVLPGLLQTEAYVRALLRFGDYPDEPSYQAGVALRLGRQALLSGTKAPYFWLVIDEAALRRQIGGPGVMREQLSRLLIVAREPYIDVQVLPFTGGAHFGYSLSLLVLPDRSRFAYRETQGWYHLTDVPEDVDKRELEYDRLIARALPPRESAAYIESVMEECYP